VRYAVPEILLLPAFMLQNDARDYQPTTWVD
jgi:hypothetical protein